LYVANAENSITRTDSTHNTARNTHQRARLPLDQLFSFNAKLDRYSEATRHFSIPDSTLSSISDDLYKIRRGARAPFISRSMIFRLEDNTTAKVKSSWSKVQEYAGTKQPNDLGLASRCLTTNVVTECALAESYNQFDTMDFSVDGLGLFVTQNSLLLWQSIYRGF